MNPFLLVLLGRMGPAGAAVGDFIARLTQSGDRRITQSGIARAVQSSTGAEIDADFTADSTILTADDTTLTADAA